MFPQCIKKKVLQLLLHSIVMQNIQVGIIYYLFSKVMDENRLLHDMLK